MDKAPDAFRTISEVADDLDIPQHVLRFWETRFTQIKPMKRSGGRRYYRPDDVDLLRGIRRLLYGEGYTIRGVQRILKEHGIKSVQRLADANQRRPRSARSRRRSAAASPERDDEARAAPGIDLDDDDYEDADGIDFRLLDTDEDGLATLDFGPIAGVAGPRPLDVARLQNVLADLIACRRIARFRAEGRVGGDGLALNRQVVSREAPTLSCPGPTQRLYKNRENNPMQSKMSGRARAREEEWPVVAPT